MNHRDFMCVLVAGLALLLPGWALAQTTQGVEIPRAAVVVQIKGEINDYAKEDFVRRCREARERGATAIVLEVDSYGGAVISGLETSRFIKQLDIPVVAFVREKAISAGAMIALACDGIYMAPHSAMGDAAPIAVSSEGMQPLGAAERAKAESPVLEDFRDSALRNGYNVLLAEAMVAVGREVYYVQNAAGEKRFVDGQEYEQLQKAGGWTAVIADRNPIDSKESLLTVHAELAKQLGLSRGMASSAEEVASARGWQVIGRLDRSKGDAFIAALAGTPARSVLMIILIVSIYAAINTPGTGLPEAAAVIALSLLLGVPLLTGYAQWWEIVLVLAGVVLLAVEIFILPGHLIGGITGAALIAIGLLMTFVPKEPVGLPGLPGLPSLGATRQGFEQGIVALSVSMLASLVICYFLARFLPHAPVFGKLVLRRTVGGGVGDGDLVAEAPDAVAAIPWVRVGDEGEALTDLRPGGTARFLDRTSGVLRSVDVLSDSGMVARGAKLRVHAVAGSEIVVRVV